MAFWRRIAKNKAVILLWDFTTSVMRLSGGLEPLPGLDVDNDRCELITVVKV